MAGRIQATAVVRGRAANARAFRLSRPTATGIAMSQLFDPSGTNPLPSDDDCSGWSREPRSRVDRRQRVDAFRHATGTLPPPSDPAPRAGRGGGRGCLWRKTTRRRPGCSGGRSRRWATTSTSSRTASRRGRSCGRPTSRWSSPTGSCPRLDGLGLCRRIRGKGGGRYTYVVLVTGPRRRAGPAERARCRRGRLPVEAGRPPRAGRPAQDRAADPGDAGGAGAEEVRAGRAGRPPTR